MKVYDINPVVLLSEVDTLNVTLESISSLLSQSPRPIIVVVCTKDEDMGSILSRFSGVHVLLSDPLPVGKRWQVGVDYCRKLDPNPLIILRGSDFLCVDYVYWASKQIELGYHFVGVRDWMYRIPPTEDTNTELLLIRFIPDNLPYSSGRCFSLALLKECRFKIFDSRANAWYDNPGLEKALGYGFPYAISTYEHLRQLGVVQTYLPTEEPDPYLFYGRRFDILYRYENAAEKLMEVIP